MMRLDRDAETSPKRLMVLIGLGLLLVLLTWWMLSDGDDAAPASPPPTAPAPQPIAPPVQPVAAPASPASAAASASQLSLFGVSGRGDTGAAMIAIGGDNQRLVRTGRNVIPGVRLISIAANSVVLDDHGREVQLFFPDAQGQSRTTSGSSQVPARPSAARQSRADAIGYLRALEPANENGRFQGYRVGGSEMPPVFTAAGIQPGDIVTSVGATRLEGPGDLERIPRELRENTVPRIEIIRNGQRQTLAVGR